MTKMNESVVFRNSVENPALIFIYTRIVRYFSEVDGAISQPSNGTIVGLNGA